MLRNLSGKTKIKVIIIACVLVAIAAYLVVFSSNKPVELKVSPGDKVVVTVVAKSVEDMYGYQFQINYNREELEFSGELKSEISGLDAVFAKPFGEYELVGATMIGGQPGISGKKQNVCRMTFTVLADGFISEDSLSLSDVRVVSSELDYKTDVSGWGCEFALDENSR